jgi:hypothetical protein
MKTSPSSESILSLMDRNAWETDIQRSGWLQVPTLDGGGAESNLYSAERLSTELDIGDFVFAGGNGRVVARVGQQPGRGHMSVRDFVTLYKMPSGLCGR